MNWTHKYISILFLLLLSCNSSQKANTEISNNDKKIIRHNNIVIVPDLSNRIDDSLYPRQLKDSDIINVTVSLFPDLIKSYNRLSMQKDKISLKLLNPLDVPNFNELEPNVTIDLGAFGTKQFERIDFINNKKDISLKKSIDSFLKTSKTIYDTAKTKGYTADLWGFFNQTLDEYYFTLTNPINSPKAKDTSRNILILLTDGYIEINTQSKQSCPEKKCRLLNYYQIEKFRDELNKDNNQSNAKAFFSKSGYGIVPVQNENLKDVEVLMLEVYDRSKSESGRVGQFA